MTECQEHDDDSHNGWHDSHNGCFALGSHEYPLGFSWKS
jgi:hypothetical protein